MAEMERRTIFPPSHEEYSLAGDALERSQIEGGGVGTAPSPDRGMRRYPTEDVTRVTHPSWRRSVGWSALGGVIGAGAMALFMRSSRRLR